MIINECINYHSIMENDYFIELNLLLFVIITPKLCFWNGRCIVPELYKLRHVYLSVNYKC